MSRILGDVGFVHLHVHSSFSLLEGALRIDELKKLALKDRMPALALTDTNNLFGALEFSEKLAGAGIQPICGITLAVDTGDERPGRSGLPPRRPGLVLLAATPDGYANLMRLASRAYLGPAPGEPPHVPLAAVLAAQDGLIALTGGPDGLIDKALAGGQSDLAESRLMALKDAFGDRLYVEIQRHGLDEDRRLEPSLLDLAYRLGLPIVGSNEPFFARADDYGAHDALLAVAEGRLVSDTERRRLTPQHDFKTRAEMVALFRDLPEAAGNTIEIAMRCHFRPRTGKPILPRFTTGSDADPQAAVAAEAAELRRQAMAGLDARLAAHGPAPGLTEQTYRDRLDFELSVIERMKYPGYFLIVADFIQWAKAHGIPVGPGRGSGAGSLVALYRPGPMANIPVYCARKHGEEEPDYLHPKLEPVLRETQGVIIYQEQVMQIAQLLSGYSLGEADLLRRAMGKKIKAEMEVQRERFVTGAVERGLDPGSADTIFDLLAKFADYGFNKSHAAAYALVAYQTAWLKANHPVEFLAASMTLDMSNTDKLSEFRREAQRLGIRVEPPAVNRSGVTFEVHPDGLGGYAIRYALAAVKGVGASAVEALVAARREGLFRDLADFARRIDPRLVNKRTLESLIAAGALDEVEPDRAKAVASLDAVLAAANRARDEAAAGQADIFGGSAVSEPLRANAHEPWTGAERLQREYEAIGFFLSGHPLDDYAPVLTRLRAQRWTDFARAVKAGASMGRVAATVLDRSERRTKSGSKMGIFALSDQSGHFEAIIFQEGLNQYRDLLEPGRAVLLTLAGSAEGEEVRARIQTAEPLDRAAQSMASTMRIFMRDDKPINSIVERLREKGDGEVSLILILDGGQREVEVRLPGRYRATPQVAGSIKAVPGIVSVEFA